MGRHCWYTPEEMKVKMDEYFEKCKGTLLRKPDGEVVMYKGMPVYVDREVPTLTGLTLYLGYADPRVLSDRVAKATEEEKETYGTYAYFIKEAKLKVFEATAQASMNRESFQGARMQLISNFGMTDKPAAEVTVNNNIGLTNEQAMAALLELGYKKTEKADRDARKKKKETEKK